MLAAISRHQKRISLLSFSRRAQEQTSFYGSNDDLVLTLHNKRSSNVTDCRLAVPLCTEGQ